LDGLVSVMSPDHKLQVFTEEPLTGRGANTDAWRGYFEGFPEYVIYPHRIAEISGGLAAVLGHTTGWHLALPDDDESRQSLIWLAETALGKVRSSTVAEDTPQNRRQYALDK
jgi:hypothetical protein